MVVTRKPLEDCPRCDGKNQLDPNCYDQFGEFSLCMGCGYTDNGIRRDNSAWPARKEIDLSLESELRERSRLSATA